MQAGIPLYKLLSELLYERLSWRDLSADGPH